MTDDVATVLDRARVRIRSLREDRRRQRTCLHPRPHASELIDLGRNKVYWCPACDKDLGTAWTLWNLRNYRPERYPAPGS